MSETTESRSDDDPARREFEAAVRCAFRSLHPGRGTTGREARIQAILHAADAYAAGDSDGVTAMRRHVLGAMSEPVPEGVRR